LKFNKSDMNVIDMVTFIYCYLKVGGTSGSMSVKGGAYRRNCMVADLCHSCFPPTTPPSEKSIINKLKWRRRGAKNLSILLVIQVILLGPDPSIFDPADKHL
jgi:hypothetical protein